MLCFDQGDVILESTYWIPEELRLLIAFHGHFVRDTYWMARGETCHETAWNIKG